MIFTISQKVKVILWSIRTFWYKGLAKNNETSRVLEKGVFLEKNSSLDERAFFFPFFLFKKRFLFGVWRLILNRYDIK